MNYYFHIHLKMISATLWIKEAGRTLRLNLNLFAKIKFTTKFQNVVFVIKNQSFIIIFFLFRFMSEQVKVIGDSKIGSSLYTILHLLNQL